MNAKNLILTFCLVSGVTSVYATPAPRTAEMQVQGTANDVEITRKIRDRLTADESLSVAAKNVTIVTVGNTITLRGSVNKADEVAKINSAATEFAAGKMIKNELKVTR